MGERGWLRASSWDAGIAEQFEVRLRRARASNRAQYVRVQASHLLESADASAREAGRLLLLKVIEDYPDNDLETKFAWEQLGDSLAGEGRLDEAERALRETLRQIHASPTGRSGTSGTTEPRLAEILVTRGDAASIDEAERLLAIVEPEVRTQAFLRDVLYRFFLACARGSRTLGRRQKQLSWPAQPSWSPTTPPRRSHDTPPSTGPTPLKQERAERHSIALTR